MQTHTETHKYTDTHTQYAQRDMHIHTNTYADTDMETQTHTNIRQTHLYTCTNTDKQTHTHTNTQTDTHRRLSILCMSDSQLMCSYVQRTCSYETDMGIIKTPQCTETQILAGRKSQKGQNKILTLADCKTSVICMPNKVKQELI